MKESYRDWLINLGYIPLNESEESKGIDLSKFSSGEDDNLIYNEKKHNVKTETLPYKQNEDDGAIDLNKISNNEENSLSSKGKDYLDVLKTLNIINRVSDLISLYKKDLERDLLDISSYYNENQSNVEEDKTLMKKISADIDDGSVDIIKTVFLKAKRNCGENNE